MSLEVMVLRAADEHTARQKTRCGLCAAPFVMGPVFAWVTTGGGPDELCERCLGGLCELARQRGAAEGSEVSWKDADRVYADARERFPGPMLTGDERPPTTLEEERRFLESAYLT